MSVSNLEQIRFTGRMSYDDPVYSQLKEFAQQLDETYPTANGRTRWRARQCGMWMMEDVMTQNHGRADDTGVADKSKRTSRVMVHAAGPECGGVTYPVFDDFLLHDKDSLVSVSVGDHTDEKTEFVGFRISPRRWKGTYFGPWPDKGILELRSKWGLIVHNAPDELHSFTGNGELAVKQPVSTIEELSGSLAVIGATLSGRLPLPSVAEGIVGTGASFSAENSVADFLSLLQERLNK